MLILPPLSNPTEQTVATQQQIIDATRKWIETVIVKYNFCPFARKELEADSIAYVVCQYHSIDKIIDETLAQCRHLDDDLATATSLIMLPDGFDNFDSYLDLVDLVQNQVIDPQYQGVYQLASFHPNYCFAGEAATDAANYTNRSPYPTLHLIREESIELALESFPDPESIPQKNIALTRRKGLQTMSDLLRDCHQPDQ